MVEAASGVGESVNQGTEGIGRGLSAKVGPLPVWGWLVVLGVGGAAVYFLVLRKGGGAGGTAYSGWGFPTGGGGGGDGGGGGGGGITPPTPTNANWLTNAIQGAVTGLGLNASEVAYYLNEYLAGNRPTGSNQAYSTFQKVVDYATQNFGLPPIAPTSGAPGASYYTTQQSWFNDVLAFLPSGTSASITSELQALFSGTTSTISQDAANAYNAAVGIVGLGPNGGLSFSIGQPPGTNPPSGPPFVVPDLAALNSWWHASSWWTTSNPGQSFVSDLTGLVHGLTAPQAQSIWDFTQANPSYFLPGVNYEANLQALLQAILNGKPLSTGILPSAPTGPKSTGGAGVPGPSR